MTNPRKRSSLPPRRRSLLALAFVLGAAGAGCMVGEPTEEEEIGAFYAGLPDTDCTSVKEWALGTIYGKDTRVTDTGDVFAARYSHTAFAPNWNPKNAGSIWLAVGHCRGAAGGGGQEQPPAPPPPPPPPQQQPPAPLPPPPGICQPNGRPGPIFDPAGTKNVGNGAGQQFIGGQCLDASDCASGCCALPCGICSGPGAQFQNGKQGCGFTS
jgi:hypothetical protein